MPDADARTLLSRSALFEGASDAVIASFLQRAETVQFAAGEIPVAETTVTQEILMILEGEIQIEVALQAPEQEVKLLRAGPGTFLGLVNFFGAVSQPCTATALTGIRAMTWKAEDWVRLCEAEPAFGWVLSRRIGRELVERMSNWIQQLLDAVSWGV